MFEVSESTMVNAVEIHPDGRVRLLSGDKVIPLKDVQSVEWRRTTKGLRPNSMVDLPDANEAIWDPEIVASGAGTLFGVDTGTFKDGVRSSHVACLTHASSSIAPAEFQGSILQVQCIDFADTTAPAERIGWIFAIEWVRRHMTRDVTVILCTDHDAKALHDVNQRTRPIVDGYYLPPGFTLIYARDRGSTLQNKLVSSAHKGATKVAELMKQSAFELQEVLPILLSGGPELALRRWNLRRYNR